MNNTDLTPVDYTQVTKAYSGKAKNCCCGCAGNYYYSSFFPSLRDYEKDQVDDKNLKRVVNKINANIATAERDPIYVSVTIGNRMYTAYFD